MSETFADDLTKPKKKRKPKTPRKNFQAQADKRFAAAIRAIGYCEECGTTEYLQCAHIISRSYSAIRTDFGNAVALCRACHMFYTPRPLEWREWARERIGIETYDRLYEKALTYYPLGVDWKAEAERLRTDVPDMRAEPLRRRFR